MVEISRLGQRGVNGVVKAKEEIVISRVIEPKFNFP